jgi:hypothetical protein
VQRDAFGITSVSGSAPQRPGNSTGTVTVSLTRFLIFNAYSGTVTVNDPQNGMNNVTTTLFLSSLSEPVGHGGAVRAAAR